MTYERPALPSEYEYRELTWNDAFRLFDPRTLTFWRWDRDRNEWVVERGYEARALGRR